MAKSMVYRRGAGRFAGDVAINMTPLIDCTLLLIVFFILSTEFSKLPQILLHKPAESQAQHKPEETAAPNRAIVSVVSREPAIDDPEEWDIGKASGIKYYKVFNTVIEEGRLDRLEGELKKRKAEARKAGFEDFFVEIRADRRVAYMYIEPVMVAAARAGVRDMHITARRE
jgi:biopolymer transport protein ExbD